MNGRDIMFTPSGSRPLTVSVEDAVYVMLDPAAGAGQNIDGHLAAAFVENLDFAQIPVRISAIVAGTPDRDLDRIADHWDVPAGAKLSEWLPGWFASANEQAARVGAELVCRTHLRSRTPGRHREAAFAIAEQLNDETAGKLLETLTVVYTHGHITHN